MASASELRWLGTAFTLVVQFLLFLRWLHKRLRDDEITRLLVQDIATNHLPHIYEMLHQLCKQQGINEKPTPLVRWIDVNEH
jgi:hypothetical protein